MPKTKSALEEKRPDRRPKINLEGEALVLVKRAAKAVGQSAAEYSARAAVQQAQRDLRVETDRAILSEDMDFGSLTKDEFKRRALVRVIAALEKL